MGRVARALEGRIKIQNDLQKLKKGERKKGKTTVLYQIEHCLKRMFREVHTTFNSNYFLLPGFPLTFVMEKNHYTMIGPELVLRVPKTELVKLFRNTHCSQS